MISLVRATCGQAWENTQETLFMHLHCIHTWNGLYLYIQHNIPQYIRSVSQVLTTNMLPKWAIYVSPQFDPKVLSKLRGRLSSPMGVPYLNGRKNWQWVELPTVHSLTQCLDNPLSRNMQKGVQSGLFRRIWPCWLNGPWQLKMSYSAPVSIMCHLSASEEDGADGSGSHEPDIYSSIQICYRRQINSPWKGLGSLTLGLFSMKFQCLNLNLKNNWTLIESLGHSY